MRPPIAVALIAAALAGCGTVPPDAKLDWEAFIGTFPGPPHRDNGYGSGTAKAAGFEGVAVAIAAGNSRFGQWCAAHGGESKSIQAMARTSAAASRFQDALAQKINADRAQGIEWVPTTVVACAEAQPGQSLLAVLVSEPGRRSEARESRGRVVDKLTRIFFNKEEATEFVSVHAEREVDRANLNAAKLRDREYKRMEATSRLRAAPRIGDRTSLGILIDIRPPLALVQYDSRYRAISNRPPTEWLRIDALTAPSEDQ